MHELALHHNTLAHGAFDPHTPRLYSNRRSRRYFFVNRTLVAHVHVLQLLSDSPVQVYEHRHLRSFYLVVLINRGSLREHDDATTEWIAIRCFRPLGSFESALHSLFFFFSFFLFSFFLFFFVFCFSFFFFLGSRFLFSWFLVLGSWALFLFFAISQHTG